MPESHTKKWFKALDPGDPITFWEWSWNLNTLLRWLYTPIIIWQGEPGSLGRDSFNLFHLKSATKITPIWWDLNGWRNSPSTMDDLCPETSKNTLGSPRPSLKWESYPQRKEVGPVTVLPMQIRHLAPGWWIWKNTPFFLVQCSDIMYSTGTVSRYDLSLLSSLENTKYSP